MSTQLNRYVGQISPSGRVTVDAPSFPLAVQQMILDNNGEEPIQVNFVERNIKAILELPMTNFTSVVQLIDDIVPGKLYPETNKIPTGSEVIFTAVPNEGYEFDHFIDQNGNILGTSDPVIKLVLTTDLIITAVFYEVP